ncbi:hypothetical protein CY34DRAFT_809049 [Suillus luteus UH-Slu-Lm8-n1]|uniref:Uncharacterized protein n=1 Tax=Suillus luteus UH-Slu-Lm8-n1 TaxID=930992 RepID=A0A0C9ZM59_9AGAM|nr:hypothetical protein CY34DRAFT_809049 [Suillus luteus UH-Slu-Lm8-n1]
MDTPGFRISKPLRYLWICDYDGREHDLCHFHSTPRSRVRGSPPHLTNCHQVFSRQTRQTWPAVAYDSSFNWMWPDGMTTSSRCRSCLSLPHTWYQFVGKACGSDE